MTFENRFYGAFGLIFFPFGYISVMDTGDSFKTYFRKCWTALKTGKNLSSSKPPIKKEE